MVLRKVTQGMPVDGRDGKADLYCIPTLCIWREKPANGTENKYLMRQEENPGE